MEHFSFYLGLSLILMHEMDAIRCHEWRFFPLTFFLDDRIGLIVFLFAHIPLYMWLFQGLAGIHQASFMTGLNYFFIIHGLLHILYLWHPKNEFKDWISWTIIAGNAVCGVLGVGGW